MTITNRLKQNKHIALAMLIILSTFGNMANAQTDTTENWRLFPSQNDVNPVINANTNNTVNNDTLDFTLPEGSVEIIGAEKIEKLNTSLSEKPCIYGYTIQLAVSQQKSVIQSARYKMIKIDSKIELDDPYLEPNIYLYAGRFYDRNTAYEFKHKIAKHFPNAIVIGPKRLDLPVMELPLQPEQEIHTPDN